MNAPYRSVPPQKDNTIVFAPLDQTDKWKTYGVLNGYPHWRGLARPYVIDGWVHDSISINNTQRSDPTVGVVCKSVLTREMWNEYKKSVDDMFDSFDEYLTTGVIPQ